MYYTISDVITYAFDQFILGGFGGIGCIFLQQFSNGWPKQYFLISQNIQEVLNDFLCWYQVQQCYRLCDHEEIFTACHKGVLPQPYT